MTEQTKIKISKWLQTSRRQDTGCETMFSLKFNVGSKRLQRNTISSLSVRSVVNVILHYLR